jgi:hypothetical protein
VRINELTGNVMLYVRNNLEGQVGRRLIDPNGLVTGAKMGEWIAMVVVLVIVVVVVGMWRGALGRIVS